MNPTDAIRLMVKSYPGGIDALAVLCGKAPETLRHEIGGKDSRYKLGVADACTISEACIAIASPHCHAFANAIAANCGGFVLLPVKDMMGGDLRADVCGMVKEASDVLGAVTEALKDNVVSDNEYRDTSRELHELQEAIQRAQRDLDAAHQAHKTLRRVG